MVPVEITIAATTVCTLLALRPLVVVGVVVVVRGKQVLVFARVGKLSW